MKELSNKHEDVNQRNETRVLEINRKLVSIKSLFDTKTTELKNLVIDTKTDVEAKLKIIESKISLQVENNNRGAEPLAEQTGPNVENEEPLTRSSSTLSVNSVESVELLTRQISQTLSSALGAHKKLIPLPKFCGEVDKWPQFIAQFERTTARENYSTEDNVTRLEQALDGDAKKLVAALLIHHVNVPKIFDRLRSRFGMPEQLAEVQISAIRKFDVILEDQLYKIVPFADQVMNLRNFLEGDGCIEHLKSPFLLKELEAKLPYRERITWGGYSMSLRPPTVVEFSDWLLILADQIHRIQPKDGSDQKKKARLYHVSYPRGRCAICEADHFVPECPDFVKMSYAERWDVVRSNFLCFGCLNSGHRIALCQTTTDCGISGCKAKHHKLMHQIPKESEHNSESRVSLPATILNCHVRSMSVLFKILPVKISGSKGTIKTYAFLDDGSSITLMNRSIAERIGADGPKSTLHLRWFGNIGSDENTIVTNVTVEGDFSKAKQYKMQGVHVVQDLKLPTQTLDIKKLHPKFHAMKKLPIQEFNNVTPSILIGLDNAHLGVTRNRQRNASDGPIVCLTKLGYVVYGPASSSSPHQDEVVERVFLAERTTHYDELHEMVKQHFSTEDFGIKNKSVLKSKEDDLAMKTLKSTTKRIGTRFECGLLWKEKNLSLPNNLPMAIKRLESCERKMKKDVNYEIAYKKTMSEYFLKNSQKC